MLPTTAKARPRMAHSELELASVFDYALNQEQTGIAFFTAAMDRIGAASAKTAFQKLIKEENQHVAYLQGLVADLAKEGRIADKVARSLTLPTSNFFTERSKSELLDQCLEQSMIPDVTVFNTAWLIEKDLSEFYGQMAGKVQDPAAKGALQMLSKWEHGHELFFLDFRRALDEHYGRMPWGG